MRRAWAELRLALSFLTSLPVSYAGLEAVRLGHAARWFTSVGLLLGALLWGVHWLLGAVFDPTLTAIGVVIAWAALTGGLHLDGVADCGDGLLAAVPRARRLEILRDSRVGGFGAITLVLLLLLKVGAAAQSPGMALMLGPVWARWWMLWVARGTQARAEGMGARFAADLSPAVMGAALVVPLIVTMGAFAWGQIGPVLGGIGLAALCAWCIRRLAEVRLGGVTGDVYGLAVEVCETVVLLVFAAPWPVG